MGFTFAVMLYLFYIRMYLFYAEGSFYVPILYWPPQMLGPIYPYVYPHFILSASIIDIQLFILFIFICVLVVMLFQAVDDSNISIGTPLVMLFCVLGSCLLLMVRDFFALYLFLELQSLALYVLVCIRKNSHVSSEVSLKYFIYGSFASCILLYGVSLIYGSLGTLEFNYVSSLIKISAYNDLPLTLFIGFGLILSGLFFKLGVAPFHV
jgi:NADH-quinone oxidoreductase subunit N